ncbi:hypothetical protein C0Q70_04673 [Pomacea canaliculata]|uniref:Uncharacterized protein n=1 Tax=Pomacea canaliculata TaxID=400727 RepID=A0A2T7PJ34_POMCA|nr:hypothetical protein C0Q70_04673 [Pomacea canaliculata]
MELLSQHAPGPLVTANIAGAPTAISNQAPVAGIIPQGVEGCERVRDKKNNNKNGRGVGEGEEVAPSITESDLETAGVGWAGGGGV